VPKSSSDLVTVVGTELAGRQHPGDLVVARVCLRAAQARHQAGLRQRGVAHDVTGE
jgi:hypothetical protein